MNNYATCFLIGGRINNKKRHIKITNQFDGAFFEGRRGDGYSPPEESNALMYIEKCDFEPNAPAVVLFDKGEVMFIRDEGGFDIRYTRHKRVKIFKESAFDQAEIEIPLYIGENEIELVKDIKATTYYYDGKIIETTKLNSSQVFEEPINKFWYKKKFAMPNLKEGCIIDYSYTVFSPFIFNLPDWEFQSNIPTIYSEYQTNMIPFYTYTYRAQGFKAFDVFENKECNGIERQFMNLNFNDMNYTFGMKNIPSFSDESFISSKEDYIKKIDFQLSEINYPAGYSKKILTTWPDLAKKFNDADDFGRYIKKSEKFGSKNFLHLQNKTDNEKIEAVLSYMKTNYKFNGINNKWASKSIKEFTTQKTGNSANINLMALGILKSLGIDCKPVIISTRDHGKVYEDFPFSDIFNNVLILAVNGDKSLILDATDPYCPTNIIPAKCCNGKGFIIDEDQERWLKIYNKTPSKNYTTLNYKFNPETGELEGNAKIITTGHLAINERKRYTSDEDKFINQLKSEGLLISDSIITFSEDNYQKFEYSFNFTSHVDQIEDQVIFNPLMKLPVQENPFKQKERDYSIDFIYPSMKSFTATIQIPEDYVFEKLPTISNKDSKNVSLDIKVIKMNNHSITISSNYYIKKPIYPASAYNELKLFYKNISEKLNQSIVISKI